MSIYVFLLQKSMYNRESVKCFQLPNYIKTRLHERGIKIWFQRKKQYKTSNLESLVWISEIDDVNIKLLWYFYESSRFT